MKKIGNKYILDPNGTIFGSADNKHGGLIMYTFDDLQVSNSDEIVFGFMTFYENGLLYKAESRLGNEYIDIRLVSQKFNLYIAPNREGLEKNKTCTKLPFFTTYIGNQDIDEWKVPATQLLTSSNTSSSAVLLIT